MHIRCGYDIIYECFTPTPIMALLKIRPERRKDLISPEILTLDPLIPSRDYEDSFGNIATRLVAPPGQIRFTADFIVHDSGEADPQSPDASQHSVDDLPDDVLVYLLGSRYCETDQLSYEAWRLFGGTPPGWARVEAIVDYVHNRITFGYEHARNTRTAAEAFNEGVGVCRDFAHLAVTLCRCMNIPARYCTGYLGDIGIEPIPGPMDFSAWFEVYLGGRWHAFDARHNKPRIGRILMAQGRDATDTAISTSFGPTRLIRFDVIAEEIAKENCQLPTPAVQARFSQASL
jgi:transglutaminase-like putative cysteine protease